MQPARAVGTIQYSRRVLASSAGFTALLGRDTRSYCVVLLTPNPLGANFCDGYWVCTGRSRMR